MTGCSVVFGVRKAGEMPAFCLSGCRGWIWGVVVWKNMFFFVFLFFSGCGVFWAVFSGG